MSLTFHLVMDSKFPTERKVQQGVAHLQVGVGNPHEEPVDIEDQIFVNRTEYFRRLLESISTVRSIVFRPRHTRRFSPYVSFHGDSHCLFQRWGS